MEAVSPACAHATTLARKPPLLEPSSETLSGSTWRDGLDTRERARVPMYAASFSAAGARAPGRSPQQASVACHTRHAKNIMERRPSGSARTNGSVAPAPSRASRPCANLESARDASSCSGLWQRPCRAMTSGQPDFGGSPGGISTRTPPLPTFTRASSMPSPSWTWKVGSPASATEPGCSPGVESPPSRKSSPTGERAPRSRSPSPSAAGETAAPSSRSAPSSPTAEDAAPRSRSPHPNSSE